MGEKELVTLVVVLILLLLAVSVIALFMTFNNRKNELHEEAEQIKEDFKSELMNSKMEIREETLRNISWELHDNIGQLVTLAKIQAQLAIEKPEQLPEAVTTIGTALNELRSLSRNINPESISQLTLFEAIKLELERYNRLECIEAILTIEGEMPRLDPKKEIILFRILQETFVNTIRHSQATTLEVAIDAAKQDLHIKVQDNGVGFDTSTGKNGIGLLNMTNRAKLIGASFNLDSTPNVGTTSNIHLHLNDSPYETHSSSS